jgi:hypothetical protein
MPDLLADDALYAKGLALLEEHLGPVQALRFLALISRQAFDYQHWRQEHFGKMSLAELLAQAQAASTQPQRKKSCAESHASAFPESYPPGVDGHTESRTVYL